MELLSYIFIGMGLGLFLILCSYKIIKGIVILIKNKEIFDACLFICLFLTLWGVLLLLLSCGG